MRRLIVVLVLALFALPVSAVTLTATTADYLWSDRFAAATNADVCVIGAGMEIIIPSGSVVCGQLDLDGSLVVGDGAILTIADPTGALTSAAEIDGTLTVLGTLLVNCGAILASTCEINVNGGQLSVVGEPVIRGKVTGITQEDCTQGYFDSSVNTAPSDCDAAGEYDVIVTVDFPVATDQYNNMRLYFPPSVGGGGHFGTYYDIRDSAPPNSLTLNGASRGQLRPHGVVKTNTIANMDTTTITLGTSLSAAEQRAFLGGHAICDADCAAATIDESAAPPGQPSYTFQLPCANSRRIIAFGSGTSATIQSAYGATACTVAGAAHLVAEPGGNWPHEDVREQVSVGDQVIIDDPAVLSIPDANMGIATVYADSGVTSQDKNFYITIADDSTIRIENADVGYCGVKDDDFTQQPCFGTEGLTTGNDIGSHLFRYVDAYYTSGGNYFYQVKDAPVAPVVEWVTLRDSAYSDANPTGDQHGFLIAENDVTTGLNLAFRGVTCRRMGDDCFYDGPNLLGDQDWNDITLTDIGCFWIPGNTQDASAECVHFGSTAAGISGRLTIERTVAQDIEQGFLSGGWNAATDGIVIWKSVLVNSRYGITSAAGSATVSTRPSAVVNFACVRCGEFRGPLAAMGKVYSSYFDYVGQSGGASVTDWSQLSSLYGVVLEGTNVNAANYQWFDPSTTTATAFEGTGPVLRDVVLITGANPPHGAGQRSGITIDMDHLTWLQLAVDHAGSRYFSRTLLGGGGTIDLNNSIAFGMSGLITAANGQPTTYNVDGNLNLGASIGNCETAGNCVGCCGANNVTTGDLGVMSDRNPYVLPGSAARSVTTTDSSAYPGARCAGPTNWLLLEHLHPSVGNVSRRAGVIDPAICTDFDGDGLWDIHDGCNTNADPLLTSCP